MRHLTPLIFKLMATVRVQALVKHVYEGVDRSPGELYDLEERWLEVLTTAKFVEPVFSPPSLKTRDMQPSEPKKYRRRDVKAE